jgi:hypothetical protein
MSTASRPRSAYRQPMTTGGSAHDPAADEQGWAEGCQPSLLRWPSGLAWAINRATAVTGFRRPQAPRART